jgi:hypothetical protein
LDKIAQKLAEWQWNYAPQDPTAYTKLEKRIAETGRKLSLITYSDLVQGIEFHVPSAYGGHGHYMNITGNGFTGLDRHILGDFLGQISCNSYCKYGFMANALVVNRAEYRPSSIFFDWMEWLNVLPDKKDDTILKFWTEELNKAHNWYKSQRKTKSKSFDNKA